MIGVTIEAWPLASGFFGEDKSKKYVFEMDASEDSTLEDLIYLLCKRYPALKNIFAKKDDDELWGSSMHMLVVLNEQAVNSMKGYQTKLQDGDRVLFVQGFAGG